MPKWKKYLIGSWSWWRPFRLVLFVYICLLVIALAFPNQFIFHPPPAGYSEGSPFIKALQVNNEENIGVYYRAAQKDMPTLFWAHGNAEDIGYLRELFDTAAAKGLGIYAYDYPGYGISDGTPNEQSCYNAAQKAWDDMTHKLGIKPESIIIYGQSVGSGPATWLANHESSAALVLVTPFVSAFRVITRIPLFPNDQFVNKDYIQNSSTPLLVIHGDQDKIISQWHGKKIYNLHTGPKQFLDIPDAGHNDIHHIAGDLIWDNIISFYQKHQSLTSKKSNMTAR